MSFSVVEIDNPVFGADGSGTLGSGNRGIILAGRDGTTPRFLVVDSSGRLVAVGAGTAGSPVGGVVTIQGVSGATPVNTQDDKATTASDTTVSVGTTSVTAVAANSARKGLIIANCNGGRTIYLRFGSTAATTTAFAFALTQGSTYEMATPVYTGAIQAIASGGGASILVQELT